MLIEKVVINASPFILLCKSGLENLLPQLFSEICMPERVSMEIIEGSDLATKKLYDYEETWITRYQVSVAEEVLVWNLGGGESEVLSLAFANKEIYTALVDDRAARKCAKTLGIITLGTGGILVLAKRRGLIDSVGENLEKLRQSGLYISDEITELLKKQAGE
jgi:predicted nucleic acid-binding protein